MAEIDIPGAFMQAERDDHLVHMRWEGKMAELVVRLDPPLYERFGDALKPVVVL